MKMDKKSARILLVEDDPSLGLLLNDLLRMEGHKPVLIRDGREALPAFHEGNFDLALLDVMLPGRDGFELTEDLRKLKPNLPILLLTARDRVEDRVRGLRAGADDYVTKPFHNEELLLRIQSLLKRRDREEGPDRLSLGDFVLDTESFTLTWPSGHQRLTPKEGKVLKLLMQRQGRTTERDLIARMVWGESGYFVGRSMDVYIVRLRKLLKADPQVKLDTIHGVGFRLEAVQKS
ncbi:response regulator transcription factor [Flavobacteriales bacterium]|nr:response regulator transcription factor [Flavobacteriales bacterium]